MSAQAPDGTVEELVGGSGRGPRRGRGENDAGQHRGGPQGGDAADEEPDTHAQTGEGAEGQATTRIGAR